MTRALKHARQGSPANLSAAAAYVQRAPQMEVLQCCEWSGEFYFGQALPWAFSFLRWPYG